MNDAETIIALRAENATLNEIAANLQRSRSNIIADNNRLREALRGLFEFVREKRDAAWGGTPPRMGAGAVALLLEGITSRIENALGSEP